MKYETQHVLLTPEKQIDLGEVVTEEDFGNDTKEISRLLKVGAIAPLKGTEDYVPAYLPPDQGTDLVPRNSTVPDFLSETPEEIDAQIVALQRRRDTLNVQQENVVDNIAKRGPGRPPRVNTDSFPPPAPLDAENA